MEIIVELLFALVFLGFVPKFYHDDKRSTLLRIGKILLLPIGAIKNNPKILRSFEKTVDFANIKEH